MSKPKPTAPRIRQLDTNALIPNPRNAKKHDDIQVAKIAGSIKEFGFGAPIITDGENGILAGHGRWLAAQKLGLPKVPCVEMGHLTETQRRAYMLADNRLAEIGGGWDMDALRIELDELAAEEIDLDALGFGDDFEIDLGDDKPEASGVDAEPQVDKAEELREKWGVEPGQLWQLGDHRILCGDSTKTEDVERVMGGEKAELIFTDPPYGVGMNIENDDLKGSEFDLFNVAWIKTIPRANDCGFVCYHSTRTFPSVLISACDAGWKFERMLWYYIPDKFPAHSWNHWMMVSQSILLFSFGNPTYEKTESDQDCYRTTSSDLGDSHAHPTEKRIGNAVRVMSHYSGVIVYEPFSGSGTTIIACEQLNRKCRAIEISPAYVAVAIQRWADATGKEPRKI